jgi:hypothetical protein
MTNFLKKMSYRIIENQLACKLNFAKTKNTRGSDLLNLNLMDKPFEITFNFPVAHASFSIPLKATAQRHHAEPYYVVDSFFFEEYNTSPQLSLLLRTEVKYLKGTNKGAWVHTHSERESLLSQAIGQAIEKSGHFST